MFDPTAAAVAAVFFYSRNGVPFRTTPAPFTKFPDEHEIIAVFAYRMA